MPSNYDPDNTGTVASAWVRHLGEPGNCFDSSNTSDRYGLLLSKNAPTATNSAAGAHITGVRNVTLTELGWDIRKSTPPPSPDGSHCGAGAPRFDVITMDGNDHFIGCDSPAPTVTTSTPEPGWERLRYSPAAAFPPIGPTDKVKSIDIVLDEGNDAGPEFFGVAILDNIDINGTMVGGPVFKL